MLAESGRKSNFADIDVAGWQWAVLLGLIVLMLLVDLLVVHKEAHEVSTKEAAIESAVWITVGVAFTGVVWWWFGSQAGGEYISGYLIEESLSVDNVFVWALIMGTSLYRSDINTGFCFGASLGRWRSVLFSSSPVLR